MCPEVAVAARALARAMNLREPPPACLVEASAALLRALDREPVQAQAAATLREALDGYERFQADRDRVIRGPVR